MYMEELTKTANNLDDVGGNLCFVRCEVLIVSMKTATIFLVVTICSLLLVFQVFIVLEDPTGFMFGSTVSHHI
jgi:hypothetical protein